MAELTILIAARNAAATIERAIGSCLAEADCPIVVIDDHSTDATAGLAQTIGGARVRVIEAIAPGGVALARQTGLNAVVTPFAAWLDADDEWIPGRCARMIDLLKRGYDVAVEPIDLVDGPSGQWLRTLSVPSFLTHRGGAVRLFERNFLPGDTQVAFRTSVFRDAGGYDPALGGPESFDLLLRALRGGARMAFGNTVGYRMYAYPDSLSRDLTRQRAALATALRKHEYEDVRELYRRAGHSPRISAWALVMLAQFRDDPAAALEFLDAASPESAAADDVLEPEGPWPQPEGWRRAFQRGTLFLQLNAPPALAVAELTQAEAIEPTAEAANNLGLAYWRLGRRSDAIRAFMTAEERRPGYRDAVINNTAANPSEITTHPLRHTPSRNDYALV